MDTPVLIRILFSYHACVLVVAMACNCGCNNQPTKKEINRVSREGRGLVTELHVLTKGGAEPLPVFRSTETLADLMIKMDVDYPKDPSVWSYLNTGENPLDYDRVIFRHQGENADTAFLWNTDCEALPKNSFQVGDWIYDSLAFNNRDAYLAWKEFMPSNERIGEKVHDDRSGRVELKHGVLYRVNDFYLIDLSLGEKRRIITCVLVEGRINQFLMCGDCPPLIP